MSTAIEISMILATPNVTKTNDIWKIKLQAMQDAPPLQLYPASDKFLMWNQRKAAKYL